MSIPIVLVLPYPAQGHVNPIMNLSKKLVEHGCKVIFVNTDFNHKRVVSSMGDDHHHQCDDDDDDDDGAQIKLVSIPDGLGLEEDRTGPTGTGKLCDSILSTMPSMLEKLIIEDLCLNNGNNDDNNRISCIVADVNMGWALEVGKKLGINGALFSPPSAAMFALQYNIPKLIHDGIIDPDDVAARSTRKTFRLSPNMPMMDTGALFWSNISEPSIKKVFNYIKYCTQTINLTEWWLCNTTYELEPEALSFLPNLLPIGPMLNMSGNYDHNNRNIARSMGQFWEEDLSCISWLDQQPHDSVVYVAFGSFTLFDQNQFKELAFGLHLTKRPFLWVVREDPNCTNEMMACPNELLGSKGKIVKWAPQQKVLSHPAIACFVSHCGWNSTLEGMSNGVPFLCWPYFSDQFFNKAYICDELKVGLGFDEDEIGLVSRGEIKMKVEQVLSDGNMRSRSLELKEKMLRNIEEGGRSSENLSRFVKWLKG